MQLLVAATIEPSATKQCKSGPETHHNQYIHARQGKSIIALLARLATAAHRLRTVQHKMFSLIATKQDEGGATARQWRTEIVRKMWGASSSRE